MVDLWNAYGAGRDRQAPDVASGIGLWWTAYLGLPVLVGFLGGFMLASANAENALSTAGASSTAGCSPRWSSPPCSPAESSGG